MAEDNPNVEIGAKEDYVAKTAPYSRDIIDWIKNNATGPKGDKGDTGDTGPKGDTGDAGVDAENITVQYSSDGINWHDIYVPSTDIYFHHSYDGGVTYGYAIAFKGSKGDIGAAGEDLQVEYSIDNITYQDTPTSPTNYIRFSLDGGSTWQAGYSVQGEKGDTGDTGAKGDTGDTGAKGDTGDTGTAGTNAYLYVAWADDDAGNGFTLTFNSSKDYRAEIQSTTVIASPNQSTFTGLWKNIAGQEGDAGTDAYTYIAYASAIDGTGFTLTNSSTLDYMAILNTGTYLAAPEVGDFTGLWFKRKGDNGSNAYWIQLPTGATVTARCAGILEQPVGWTMDAGNVITNPLSTSGVDLVINHGLGKKVVSVSIKKKISDRQQKLIGINEFAGWEDDTDGNFLSILSITEELATIDIYIMFES